MTNEGVAAFVETSMSKWMLTVGIECDIVNYICTHQKLSFDNG